VRKIISTYLALLPCELRFTYNEYGKLAVSDDQNDRALNFNLSHSADLALHIDCRKPSCHSPTIGFQNARNLDGLALIKLYGNVTPALVGRRLSAEKARRGVAFKVVSGSATLSNLRRGQAPRHGKHVAQSVRFDTRQTSSMSRSRSSNPCLTTRASGSAEGCVARPAMKQAPIPRSRNACLFIVFLRGTTLISDS
jgi:hypothetical protein